MLCAFCGGRAFKLGEIIVVFIVDIVERFHLRLGLDGGGFRRHRQGDGISDVGFFGRGNAAVFAVIDGLETIVTGICLDTTYGYAMPEGDGIIIVGMEYAIFALGCWIYLYWKEDLQSIHQAQRTSDPWCGCG